jgi:hypothetical protein
MSKTIIPANYTPALNLYDTQRAIGTVKRLFADTLCATLNLYRVSAPLFLEASTGLNDDLNGVERKVTFDIKESGIALVIAKSFARIFYRNSINIGLPIMECPEAADAIAAGDEVHVDFDTGVITDKTTGQTFQAEPFPPFIQKIIADGGLMKSLTK